MVERDELEPHCLREARIHGEAEAVPGGAYAKALKLPDDDAAVALFPGPHAPEELFATQLVAGGAFGPQRLLYLNLRGDAGVVAARLEQRLEASHALVADEGVDDGVVEGVTEMQGPGDVRRRDGNRERRLVAVGVGRERLVGPARRPPGLDLTRIVAGRQVVSSASVWLWCAAMRARRGLAHALLLEVASSRSQAVSNSPIGLAPCGHERTRSSPRYHRSSSRRATTGVKRSFTAMRWRLPEVLVTGVALWRRGVLPRPGATNRHPRRATFTASSSCRCSQPGHDDLVEGPRPRHRLSCRGVSCRYSSR